MNTPLEKAQAEYPCTECAADAYVGFSDVRKGDKVIVKENERLCPKCCTSRGVPNFIHSPKKK